MAEHIPPRVIEAEQRAQPVGSKADLIAEVARLRADRDELRRHYEDVMRVLQAAFEHAAELPRNTRYPGTNFLTLCTLEGRKAGAVTVGESRLPVAGVLAAIRACGVAEATVMWTQLSPAELTVLERLVTDLDEREAQDVEDGGEDVDDARESVAEYLTAHCENRLPDEIAHVDYHDGMGHGIGWLSASDLKALLDELDRLRYRERGHLTDAPCPTHGPGPHVISRPFLRRDEWFCKLCDDNFTLGRDPDSTTASDVDRIVRAQLTRMAAQRDVDGEANTDGG
jgi:hypothetical protein